MTLLRWWQGWNHRCPSQLAHRTNGQATEDISWGSVTNDIKIQQLMDESQNHWQTSLKMHLSCKQDHQQTWELGLFGNVTSPLLCRQLFLVQTLLITRGFVTEEESWHRHTKGAGSDGHRSCGKEWTLKKQGSWDQKMTEVKDASKNGKLLLHTMF